MLEANYWETEIFSQPCEHTFRMISWVLAPEVLPQHKQEESALIISIYPVIPFWLVPNSIFMHISPCSSSGKLIKPLPRKKSGRERKPVSYFQLSSRLRRLIKIMSCNQMEGTISQPSPSFCAQTSEVQHCYEGKDVKLAVLHVEAWAWRCSGNASHHHLKAEEATELASTCTCSPHFPMVCFF